MENRIEELEEKVSNLESQISTLRNEVSSAKMRSWLALELIKQITDGKDFALVREELRSETGL